MATKQSDETQLEQARLLACGMLKLIEEWLPKRYETVQLIYKIADKLDRIHGNVNIAKITGASMGILGGIAGFAAIVATGRFIKLDVCII
jgi:hypothetical protein